VADMTTTELYVRAMAATQRYVDRVKPEQLEDPTPCSQWNMRQVVNHIVGENLCKPSSSRGNDRGRWESARRRPRR
jgi:hypothetical protein